MANVIKPKRTNTAGNTPTTSNLASGELGVNMADQKTYINNGTSIVQIGAGNLNGLGDVAIVSPTNNQALTYNSTTGKWINSTSAGAGDVAGPASATDNALARFDGTTGKLIQNSVATLSDAGAMDVPNITVDYTQYDTAATVASAVGQMSWDSGNGSLSLGLKNGNVDLKLGEQEYVYCFNDTGVAITKGQVVYINGAQGNRVSVLLAIATGDATSGTTIGLVAESIAIGAEGWVQISGPIYKMNTLGLTAGAPIYLSPTTAGAYTTTKPVAPQHLVTLGFVSRVDNIVGSIFIKVDNGYELDELHNVLITTPVNGNTLVYDAAAGVWENASLTSGTGISITNGPGSISIANAGVTSISGGTTGLTPSSATTGAVTLAGTLGTANGGTGLTSFTANGIPYANTTTTLATGSALSFNGSNLLVGTTINPTGTGKISTSSGYTAPDNAAGAGTTLSILGSTGTGQAGATGGNGSVQIIGGGGTSPWTTYTAGAFTRRRGGILLQAGLAVGDAGATFVSGSTINIIGSSSTNNGTSTGAGSQILLQGGSAVAPTGTNNGGSLNLVSSSGSSGGTVLINAGAANATSASGGSVSVSAGGSASGAAGSANVNAGNSTSGTGGNVSISSGSSTSGTGGNVSISSGSGTTPGKIGFSIGALGEVVQIGSTGAIGLSGANYGTAGQVLTSGGSSAVPTWTTPGGSPATPTTLGTVYGYTDLSSSNISLGYSAGANTQGTGAVAIGTNAGSNFQGNYSIAVGLSAGESSQAANSIVLNATGSALSTANTGLYVKPVRTSVAAVGTQWNLIWDDNTGEISAIPGAPPPPPSWYSYEVSTGSNVSVALPSGWDPAISQTGYLWTFTSSGGSSYNPAPSFAWSNLGNYTYFFRVFQSTFAHAPPYPEYLDPTNFDFSSDPGIYTMLYINPTTDGKTNLYNIYPPDIPSNQFGSGDFTAGGFPLFGVTQAGHSAIQMIGNFSDSSTYLVPSSTGTLDDVVYDPASNKTIFFISHTSPQLSQISMGTPILVATSTPFTGSMTFWYSYSF